jgi:hypothetical protein
MSCNNHNVLRMNHVVSLIRAAALLLAALFAAPMAFALDSGDIIVTSLRGEVHITANGAPKQVRAGGVLELPATVRTGRDGGIELRQGATTVSVGPDTLLDFPALEHPGAPIDRIQQPRGNAFYSIGKRDGRKLRVETPYLVGVVKGTQFNVASQDEATTISLFEGRLEVRATDESAVVDLKAGEIAARRRGDKSIAVIRMDAGKLPTTAPRAQVNGQGSENQGSDNPGSDNNGGGPLPGESGPSLVDRPSGGLVVAVNDPRGPAVSGDVGADVRAPGVAVTGDTAVSLGGGNAAIDVAAGAAVGNVVDTNTSVNVSAGAGSIGADVSAGANLDAGPVGADLSTSTSVGVSTGGVSVDNSLNTSVVAGPVDVDVGTSTGLDVGASGVAADVGASAGVSAGSVAVDTGASVAVDLGGGGISADLGTSTSVDAGPITAGVDTGTSVDVGAGGVAADLGASTVVDAGPVTAGVDTGAAVDVGASGVAADLGTSAAVDAGAITADLGASAGVDAGTGATVTVDTAASLGTVGQTPVDVSVGVDVSTGSVDVGVSVGGVDLGLNVDLGLGGNEPATDTGSSTSTATDTGNTGTIDVGGLLDGLLRRPGRK